MNFYQIGWKMFIKQLTIKERFHGSFNQLKKSHKQRNKLCLDFDKSFLALTLFVYASPSSPFRSIGVLQ